MFPRKNSPEFPVKRRSFLQNIEMQSSQKKRRTGRDGGSGDRGGKRGDRGEGRRYDRGDDGRGDRGGDRGEYSRGGDRGEYSKGGDRGGDRGEYSRGGDRGEYSRGGDRGEYSRGGDRGEYSRGGDRGEYSRGGDRGEYSRGGDRGEYSRGGDRGEYSRGGDRGEYSRGGDRGEHSRAGERQETSRGERQEGEGGPRPKGKKPGATEVVKTKPETCITKQGDFGTKITLLTNYFKLETMTDWTIYQYRVDFSLEEPRELILKSWLRQHKDRLGTGYIFDGSMLFSSQRFVSHIGENFTLTSLRDGDNLPITITIKLVGQLQYGNAIYLQVFNILVRRCLVHLQLQLVSRNYFDPKSSIQLRQHSLEIWPGYITSIRQHESSVLMCTEITHKVMRTDTALKVLQECMRETSDYRRVFQQTMIGTIVLTDYNNKTYRVDDVDFNQTPLSTFKYKNEEYISYVKYYKDRYQIKLTEMKQPLLVSRASAKDIRGGKESQCLLIPELCRMTGLTEKMIENRNLMKDLADITRIGPQTRIQRLRNFNTRLQGEPLVAADFKQWGMTLAKDLMSVPAREFPAERIIVGNSMSYSAGPEVDWSRSLRNSPMLHCAKFESFAVLCPNRMRSTVDEFLGILKRAADGMSFRMPRPVVIETNSDAPMDMVGATESAIAKLRPDLVMYAFTSDRQDRYSAVKKKCYVDRGVLSQVVLMKSMKAKGVMSIATKIAVQINSKIGGAPWTVHIPAENVMVIGYDVCHDKTRKANSVGAVVASMNKAMSTWFSSVNYHSSGEELSNCVALDICKAIRKYKEYNNDKLPNRIFFYRDGVGEGQLNHVYKHEVESVKKQLTELYGGPTWKMAYIVVTKRIHTRFFNQGQNPKPGTIVDDVVTLPEKYDFFLVSQSVRQGTVTPTSYNVLSDNLDWGPNHIQRFTYKMTHLYYNCSATVRVPAPCQYAHKLAFMVSQNLHGYPHQSLTTKLFFL